MQLKIVILYIYEITYVRLQSMSSLKPRKNIIGFALNTVFVSLFTATHQSP